MMRWWWKRSTAETQQWSPPYPIPDHDVVLASRQRCWADLLADRVLREPTLPLPMIGAPLMTPGQRWRSREGRR